MNEYIIRPYREEDRAAVLRVWFTAFGDCPELVQEMLDDCGLAQTGLVAEAEGAAVGCVFRFDGLVWCGMKASYIYALSVLPEYGGRGIGSALCLRAAAEAFALGAEISCLQPSDEYLARWYFSLGFRPGGTMEEKSIDLPPMPMTAVRELSGEEYLRRRKSSFGLTPQLLGAQNILNRYCGGAFVEVGGAETLAVESDGLSLLIREASCTGETLAYAAAAAARHFAVKYASYLSPRPNGEEPFMYMRPDGSRIDRLELFPFSLC